jgi:hypothetical protein
MQQSRLAPARLNPLTAVEYPGVFSERRDPVDRARSRWTSSSRATGVDRTRLVVGIP